MKHNVGDKVRVKEVKDNTYYGPCWTVEDMPSQSGKIVTIKEIDINCYHVNYPAQMSSDAWTRLVKSNFHKSIC